MIITRTPLRVSLVGGGSDMATFYRRTPGAVLSMAVTKYFYLSMHENFFEDRCLIKYSKTEDVSSSDEIEHSIIRAVFNEYNISGIDFSSAADVPAGTGMGSSSAFTVGLLQLVQTYLGMYESQPRLAEHACRIEIETLGNPIGKQDQYGCAIGGLKFMQFNPDETVDIEPIFLHPDERAKLEESLILFYVGNQRSAHTILAEQNDNLKRSTSAFDTLGRMADQAFRLKSDILTSVDAVGHYLREAWEMKRVLASSISTQTIEEAHQAAMGAGAVGAKLLGAGGGGFLLVYVPVERQAPVRQALSKCAVHRVKLDTSGSLVIYDDRTSWPAGERNNGARARLDSPHNNRAL
jgi:D-glycero-alpha-D-manno-heptose-7-phosphate kinase